MPDLSGSETHRNLARAFARESEANRRYLWFAEQADVEGHPATAALFRSIADGETGHAHGVLEFLARVGDPASGEPIGDTADNLRASITSETHDATQLYPKFAQIARDEGFVDIADWFDTLADAEQHQLRRLSDGLADLA